MARILLVIAKKDDAEALQALEDWGYVLEMVKNEEETGNTLKQGEPAAALVVIDAGGAWVKSFRIIRKAAPCVPVVALSAFSGGTLRQTLDRHGLRRAEFAGVLGNPFRIEELLLAIETAAWPCREVEAEGPLSAEKRKEKLHARRRRLDEGRLKNFLARRTRDDAFSWQADPAAPCERTTSKERK